MICFNFLYLFPISTHEQSRNNFPFHFISNLQPPKPTIQTSLDDSYRSTGGLVSMVPRRSSSTTSSEGMTLIGNSKHHMSYPEDANNYHTHNVRLTFLMENKLYSRNITRKLNYIFVVFIIKIIMIKRDVSTGHHQCKNVYTNLF